MTVHEEELLSRIRELEKQNGYLHQQIKEHRYGLTWIDVPEAFEKASENKIPILEEVKDKSFTDGSEKPTHILIEGDNYHALTCLQYTHKGKIDVIYIDPPYNTGSDGFTYKDKRFLEKYPDGTPVPKDHPLRHSYWLSFMQKRLELAKNLLSDDGVIFISIDDNEQANLKLLCDKVFDGAVELFIWRKSGLGRDGKMKNTVTFRNDHEYIIVSYNCNKHLNKSFEKPQFENTYDNPDNDPRGPYKAGSISRKEDASNPSHENYYTVESPSGKKFTRQFDFPKSVFDELNADGRIYWGKNGDAVPSSKVFINEERLVTTSSLIDNKECTTTIGSKELDDILCTNKVGNAIRPKPSELIRKLVQIASNPNSIVLDFFAGTGTTLQAILKQNIKDNGARQAILIQLPETTWETKNGVVKPKKGSEEAYQTGFKTIIEITYNRIRRVIQGYTNAKSEKIAGLGGSLKYYRTAFTGTGNPLRDPIMLPSDEDRISLAKNAGVLVSLAENTLYEIVKKDYYQIFTNNHGRFSAVYLQEDFKQFEDFRQEIEKLGGNVTVYIFSWGNNPDAANAFMHLSNVEVKSYPNAILDAYKSAMQQIESQK